MRQEIPYLWCVPLILFCIDRFAKLVALSRLDGGSFLFIPGFLEFKLSLNQAVLFFFPLSQYIQERVFFMVALLLGGWIVHTLRNVHCPFYREFLFFQSVIAIGAVSNIYDRLQYGAVIDWITMSGVGVCNLADIYIVIGMIGCASLCLSKKYSY